MSVPLVVFSPVAIASAWRLGQRDGGIETVFGNLSEPGRAQFAVPLIIGTATFGAVCGLALLAFLAVLRGRAAGRPVLPAAIAVGAIVALATVAVGLQTFSFVFTLTRGGPNRSTQTLAVLQSTRALTLFDFGDGAVVATVTGLILAVLGVGATLIAILAALRIELTPADRAVTDSGDPAAGPVGRPSGPGGTLIAVVALLAVLAVVVAGSWPWLSALFSSSEGPPSAAGARTYVNTWVPPLLGALVSVGTAFLAALGIGGLRPLGRHSEWLLLPFAPWLFVGIGPLSIAGFDNARSLDLINTFPGLVPPLLLSVPALVVLTLFCRGQSARWHALLAAGAPAGPGFLRVVVAPALPLAAFLGGATVLINAQDLLWPLVIGASRDSWTAPLLLTTETGRFAGAGGSVGITTPIVVVVIALIALAALQVFYLDRLAITSDRSAAGTATGAPTPGPAPR
jgi:hypothetical protein